MRPGPIVKNLSNFKNYSKVRASQKLSLKQKVKYWNMSMPQAKTGASGTQPKWKPSAIIGPQLLDLIGGSTTNNGAFTFDIDQNSKDRCSNIFSKFASPAVPISKPGGKQNWSWESLDPETQEGESARENGTIIAVYSPKKPAVQNFGGSGQFIFGSKNVGGVDGQTIPGVMGVMSEVRQESCTGNVPSIFGPPLAVDTDRLAFTEGAGAMYRAKGESASGNGTLPSIFGPRREVNADEINTETGITFRKFATFPKEIRDMIWDKSFRALPPQAVIISVDLAEIKKVEEARQSYNKTKVYRARADYQIPVLMHTCQESRAVGLKKYSIAFREQLCGKPVLFDYEKDVLLFTSKAAFLHFYGGTVIGLSPASVGFRYDMNEVHRKVRHLAIAGENATYTTGVNPMGWTLNLWTGLRLLVLSSSYSDTSVCVPLPFSESSSYFRSLFLILTLQNYSTSRLHFANVWPRSSTDVQSLQASGLSSPLADILLRCRKSATKGNTQLSFKMLRATTG
jgi:hypothetical protein